MTDTSLTYVELSGGPADGEVYRWPADLFHMRVDSFPGIDPAALPNDPLPRCREYVYWDTFRLTSEGRRVFATLTPAPPSPPG